MKINFNEQIIKLLPSGACFNQDSNALILADLHLGKGVLLQENGVPLLQQIDEKTITKLQFDLITYKPKYCIICGDLIHGNSKKMALQLKWFEQKINSFPVKFIMTIGNHDTKRIEKTLEKVSCVEAFYLNDIKYAHYESTSEPCISGHIHPGVKIKQGRIYNKYKAFCKDDLNLICPSYGHYTGMITTIKKNKTYYYIENNTIKTFTKNKYR